MLDRLKDRLVKIKGAPLDVARAAAPKIQAKLRADATTRRGNVPSFGKMGEIPITAEVRPEAITVTAPDWVMKKARVKNQIEAWIGIVQFEAARILRGE